MRCFFVFFIFCSVFSISKYVCVCVCACQYIYISLCAISYSEQEKAMDCPNLDWSFFLLLLLRLLRFSLRSRLSIFIRQVAPMAARSANNEKTMYVQEGLGFEYEYGHMVKGKKTTTKKFSLCYMWHPLVKRNLSRIMSSIVFLSSSRVVDQLSLHIGYSLSHWRNVLFFVNEPLVW